MSCRRSSPDWMETDTLVLTSHEVSAHLSEDRYYLEDDIDVVSQRVQVLKGQPEWDGVGVEEGT